jgi:hypothetical protein
METKSLPLLLLNLVVYIIGLEHNTTLDKNNSTQDGDNLRNFFLWAGWKNVTYITDSAEIPKTVRQLISLNVQVSVIRVPASDSLTKDSSLVIDIRNLNNAILDDLKGRMSRLPAAYRTLWLSWDEKSKTAMEFLDLDLGFYGLLADNKEIVSVQTFIRHRKTIVNSGRFDNGRFV